MAKYACLMIDGDWLLVIQLWVRLVWTVCPFPSPSGELFGQS